MAHISSGTSLTATSFNGLLKRLEAVRKNHLNKDGQSSAANTALSAAFNTSVAVAGNKAMSSNVQSIKDDLNVLSKSVWLSDTLSSQISVPSVGTLIKAADFNVWDDVITDIEAVCPNYSQYSQYGQYGNYGNYGEYSNYSNYGDYRNFSNYYQYSNYYNYTNYYQYRNGNY